MSFFSPEAEMALLAPDDSLSHLYPSSTCQSSPDMMYSPPLHPMAHPMSTSLSASEGLFTPPHEYRPMMETSYPPQSLWSSQSSSISMSHVSAYSYPPFTSMASLPIPSHDSDPFPQPFDDSRTSRSHSASSSAGFCIHSTLPSETSPPSLSRSLSPSSPDLRAFGVSTTNGTWRCAYPGCTSKAVFTRGCDLRKHHKRHTKSFFCRHNDCPQSSGGGFSSKKDLARHEAKHNPGVLCDWDGCDRVFSRVDNMVRIDGPFFMKQACRTNYQSPERPCQADPFENFPKIIDPLCLVVPPEYRLREPLVLLPIPLSFKNQDTHFASLISLHLK